MARDTLLTLVVLVAVFGAALALALWPVVVEIFRRAGQTADALIDGAREPSLRPPRRP